MQITVQFVQIALRLSGSYRFPLPGLVTEFMDALRVFEILDVAQVPMYVSVLLPSRRGFD